MAAAVKPGWDLAAEYVNNYLGAGGEFFAPGSAELAIDNENGLEALEVMRAMTQYMDPDYLTFDATEMQKEYSAGNVATMNEWGSLANAVLGDEASAEGVLANTTLAASPTIGSGTVRAAAMAGRLYGRREHLR